MVNPVDPRTLPQALQAWLDPQRPLPEPRRFFPLGLNRPIWAIPIWLLFLIPTLLTVWQATKVDSPAALVAVVAPVALVLVPLGIFSLITLGRWWRGTRARRLHRQGRWRQGLYLLDQDLLYYDGRQVTRLPRTAVRDLRTPTATAAANQAEKRKGKHRLKPAIHYQTPEQGSDTLVIDGAPGVWWQRLEAEWDTWRHTGAAPSPAEPESPATMFAGWTPVIVYLHVLYLVVTLLGIGLVALVALVLGGEPGFIAGFIVGLPLLFVFPVLAFLLWRPVRRLRPALPKELTFQQGGAYAMVLGVFATLCTIVVSGQTANWWLTAFAQRLGDVPVAQAHRYQGDNVLLGLPDARADAARYGAYRPMEYNTYNRRREPGEWHYVTRLHAAGDPGTCIYLGATQDIVTENIRRHATAARVLVTAPFYREPLFLTDRDTETWERAIADLGDGPRCRMMVVEPVADPDALAAAEWRGIWQLTVLLQVLPFLLLLGWAVVRYERRWQ